MKTGVKKNRKFEQLISAAHDLLMQHGLRRITVEEICFKAKISKMTFYKHFKNKTDLAVYILTGVFDKGMAEYRDLMARQIPFPEKVRRIVQLKQQQTEMYSREFFKDLFDHPDPGILELMNRTMQDSRNMFLDDMKIAQAKGDIRQSINPEFILYFLNAMTQMVKDEHLLNHYGSPSELIMELTNFFFYGILPADKKE